MMESEQMKGESGELDSLMVFLGAEETDRSDDSRDSDHYDEIEQQPGPSNLQFDITRIKNKMDQAMKLLEGMDEKRTQLNWICLSIKDGVNSLSAARDLSSDSNSNSVMRRQKESLNEAGEELNAERVDVSFSCSSSEPSPILTCGNVQMTETDTESQNAEKKSDGEVEEDVNDAMAKLVTVEENDGLREEKEESQDN